MVPSSSLICFPPVRPDLRMSLLKKTMSAADKVGRAEWCPPAFRGFRVQTPRYPSSEWKGKEKPTVMLP